MLASAIGVDKDVANDNTAPKFALLYVLARSAQETRELAAVMPQTRITALGLPEHKQLAMY